MNPNLFLIPNKYVPVNSNIAAIIPINSVIVITTCFQKVYYTNDERFRLKDKINELTNSEIKEQKDYKKYE